MYLNRVIKQKAITTMITINTQTKNPMTKPEMSRSFDVKWLPVSEKNHNSYLPIAKFLPESSGLFSFSVAAVTLFCDVTVEVCGLDVVRVEGEAWHEIGGSDLM